MSTTHEGVLKVIPQPLQDLHPATNALATIYNPCTTMTTSISATTKLSSGIPEHTPLFPEYNLDISTYMIQQLGVKW